MLDPLLQFFGLEPDFDLALMKPGQTLYDITANALLNLRSVLHASKPEIVLVQGDTTTAFAGALAAFYEKIPVGHVEAGLRTQDKFSPFPEEMNRVLISRLADVHFAPTESSRRALESENITAGVHVTGNTVTDALLWARDEVQSKHAKALSEFFSFLDSSKRMVLVTGHRRESFGRPFERICEAIRTLATRFPDVEFVYPVHLNPNVREPVERILSGVAGVHLIEPLNYPQFVFLLSRALLVLTDSGGVQEEAPSLGKPVLVLREVTERPEGIEAGCAKLVGTEHDRIVAEVSDLLVNTVAYAQMARAQNPYGDGRASKRIADVLNSLRSPFA
jgi:UDP-N-acetylglucosamine 2-epimerase (non-hydrolysing)